MLLIVALVVLRLARMYVWHIRMLSSGILLRVLLFCSLCVVSMLCLVVMLRCSAGCSGMVAGGTGSRRRGLGVRIVGLLLVGVVLVIWLGLLRGRGRCWWRPGPRRTVGRVHGVRVL